MIISARRARKPINLAVTDSLKVAASIFQKIIVKICILVYIFIYEIKIEIFQTKFMHG